jgi:hypothetical protein
VRHYDPPLLGSRWLENIRAECRCSPLKISPVALAPRKGRIRKTSVTLVEHCRTLL